MDNGSKRRDETPTDVGTSVLARLGLVGGIVIAAIVLVVLVTWAMLR